MKKITKSRFLKIACPRCNVPQIVFGKAASLVKCKNCDCLLLRPSGGKAKIIALVRNVIWWK